MLRIEKRYKVSIYVALIFGMLVYTFVVSIQNGMHQMFPEGIEYHRMSVGIAISELRYGLTGYRGYNKIYKALKDNGMTKNFKGDILNNAIQMALSVKDASSGGQYNLVREDKGMVTYYKLAFRIFGYKIESFFYLYFLLMAVSIFIFLMSFHNRVDLLNVLLLFVCSHFVIAATAPVVGLELQTVYNQRFLPVLAILPSLYLALLILGRRRCTLGTIAGVCMQTSILMLVVHARTSTTYQMIFLFSSSMLAILWYWLMKPDLGKYVFSKVCLWPLGLVFVGFLILTMHLIVKLDPSYTYATSKHFFWHAVYLGLGAHPDSWRKYGIKYEEDSIAARVVERRARERYGTNLAVDEGLYESILKDEFFRILKQDPRFVIENYFYKFAIFFSNYFSSSFGAIGNLFKPTTLSIVVLGSLLAGEVFLKWWLQYFWLLILEFGFSLLPTMLAMPAPALIADPALLFTVVVYTLLSGALCYVIQRRGYFTMSLEGRATER